MSIFDHYQARYEAAKDEELSLQEFLTLCKDDKSAYANAAERLLMAIGEPELIDTAQDPCLSRIFQIGSFPDMKPSKTSMAWKKRLNKSFLT